MHGYVLPDRPELKVKEYELYKAYYCGLCRSVKRRVGNLPRLVLSFDYVFLALVLSSLSTEIEEIDRERCLLHPIQKRSIAKDGCSENKSIDYAADMMVLLSYFKLADDKRDEGSFLARAGLLALKRPFKKLQKEYGEKSKNIHEQLLILEKLEKENCQSLDRVAEPFSKLMGQVFSQEEADHDKTDELRNLGYHLGKWIYLIDAYDDIDENIEKENYNPLVSQWEYDKEAESIEDFKKRIKERVELNLNLYLAELAEIWEGLGGKKNKGLIENIIYGGLLKKTEEVLRGKNHEKSL